MKRVTAIQVSLVAAVSVAWVVFIPWDLSEIDTQGRRITGGGDDVFGSWRAAAFATVSFVAVVVAARAGLRRRSCIAVAAISASFWFLYRTGNARVDGANMFLAGWLLSFLPASLVLALCAATIGRAMRRRVERNGEP